MRYDPADLAALEPAQFASATSRPLPRRKLSRAVTLLLFGLRLYVLIAVPLVVYAFVRALGGL